MSRWYHLVVFTGVAGLAAVAQRLVSTKGVAMQVSRPKWFMSWRKEILSEEQVIERLPRLTIPEVGSQAQPEVTEYDCPCGGKLVFQPFDYKASMGDQDLEVEQLYGYKCDNPSCIAFSLLPATEEELTSAISAALASQQ